MITKLITSQTIVSKVIADLNISEESIRISDMIEWCGEALNKIGGITQMNPKEDIIEILCGQAKLPCDLNKLIQVAYATKPDGGWCAMRYNTGSFVMGTSTNSITDGDRHIHEDLLVQVYRTMYRKDHVSYNDALAAIHDNVELKSVLESLLKDKSSRYHRGERSRTNFSNDLQYFVKPGYIMCSERSGWLKLAYNSIPVDDHGYPMIPDNESYIEAIYWYVVMKLQYPDYVSGKISQAVYYDTRHSWNYYCKQAYGNSKMPNLDEFESIKNAWLRLVPVLDEHETFYSNVGQVQHVYNRNK